ncbi:MAG: tetratricopeptide repeat protein [Planctomycetota bacterium]
MNPVDPASGDCPAADDCVTAGPLDGQRVLLLGQLASMPRREASRVLRQHGAKVCDTLAPGVTLILVGDETEDWGRLVKDAAGDAVIEGAAREVPVGCEVVRESELWRRIGFLADEAANDQHERLYTPAMLAELIGAPADAIRRWQRRGYLIAEREVGRLPYFAMREVHVARNLSRLLAEGCTLQRIDRLVAQLTSVASDVDRPLSELAVVVDDGRIYLRKGDELAEPGGQLLLDFDVLPEADRKPSIEMAPQLAIGSEAYGASGSSDSVAAEFDLDDARALALERQAEGDSVGAIEACRAVLFAGGDVEDHVLLAELLYRGGDATAARERYYVALECDGADVEARVSLGCLLAETGDTELAVAAFRGALREQPSFADAHYHLARTLDELGDAEGAEEHWRRFRSVAPASPWADEAADRLGND